MKAKKLSPWLILSAAMTLSSCFQQETAVSFEVNVRSNQSEPVAGATVRVGEQTIGETSKSGALKAEVNLPQQTRQKIEILKDSDRFYYAPYFDSIDVGSGDTQNVKVEATLYFVPKPSSEEQQKVEESYSGSLVSEDNAGEDVSEATSTSPQDKLVESKPTFTEADLSDAPSLNPVTELISPEVIESSKEKNTENEKPTTFRHTVYVYSQKAPVANAEVLVADKKRGKYRKGCLTNSRGRCSMKFPSGLGEQLTDMLVTAKGYHSQRKSLTFSEQGKTRFNLPRGESVDVFANLQTFQYIQGLADVEVLVKGQSVGKTDSLGHLTYIYPGKKSDLIDITLKSDAALPQIYEADFVVSGPMSLVKHFAPNKAPPVKVAIWDMQIAGELANDLKVEDITSLESAMSKGIQAAIVNQLAFKEIKRDQVLSVASAEGISRSEIVGKGWHKTDLKGDLDAVIVPTIIVSGDKYIELSFVDSKGKVLAASKQRLVAGGDVGSEIKQVVEAIFKDVSSIFPFEGSIVARDGKSVTINIGSTHDRGMKVGSHFDVYGIQIDRLGKSQTHAKIGLAKVTSVGQDSSKALIVKNMPRSAIEIGDIVVATPAPAVGGKQQTELFIKSKDSSGLSQQIAQANVYFNEAWIGSTDQQGRLELASKLSGKHGLIKVIKSGYRDFAREMTISSRKSTTIQLSRESAYLQIESSPEGARVSIDGKDYGRTPIKAPVPVPSGFVKVEVGDLKGFKNYTQVLEFEQGTLDLTAGRRIKLEQDVLSPVHVAMKKGDYQRVSEILGAIPESHSDFAEAQHLLGEVLLLHLDEPARAAAAFHNVTSRPQVREFVDKRFIGSHVNEGIALVLTAEKLQPTEPEAAASHLQKSIQVLQAVQPQLRFVAQDEYARAVHNTSYYLALAKHRLWSQSESELFLDEAQKSWRSYLDISANGLNPAPGQESYPKRAEVYYRQVEMKRGIGLNQVR